jgi:hypothetical protein
LDSDATSRTGFASDWTDLTDGGETTLHTHAGGVVDGGLNGNYELVLSDATGSVASNPAAYYNAPNTQFVMDSDINFKGHSAKEMACDNGTSFPTPPATAQWFYRTDLKTLFQYEGGWKAIQSFGAVSLYVDATNGTDAVGQGYSSGAGATKSIQYAINLIPALNGGNVVIYVTAETYDESVSIANKAFSGNYTLTIVGALPTADDSGTATSATGLTWSSGIVQATLVDSTKAWTVNQHQNKLLVITGGAGVGQEFVIDSNDATTLTLVGVAKVALNSTSTYAIYDQNNFATITSTGHTGNLIYSENQKNLVLRYLNFADCRSSNTFYTHFTKGTSVTIQSCAFQALTSNAVSAGLFIQVDVGAVLNRFVSNFVNESGTLIKASFGLRIQNASAPVEGTITGGNLQNSKFYRCGIQFVCAAQAYQTFDPQGHGLVFRNPRTRAVDINSFSRADFDRVLVADSAGAGIVVRDSGYFLWRAYIHIKNCATNGLDISNKGIVISAGSNRKIEGCLGWGIKLTVSALTTITEASTTFASNTLGNIVADYTSIIGVQAGDVRAISATTTLDDTHDVATVSGAITITLPTAVGIKGKKYTIKKIDTGTTTTIATTSSQTVDGAAPATMTTQWEKRIYCSDGQNWLLV